ncbi:hypothetical protein OV203_21210 [Nannocystis sp. ILAH1]|uniref:hypothetical protein n=1 Tax=Nannocystis sp. ILAH1 TaxID=2996789 RepID=UPI00226EA31F|nr:hypothetical protein [Nannocystis sp. ILAH1]MCY0989671.1 hypothetical protein [Nannocystis sp. ILAH1]
MILRPDIILRSRLELLGIRHDDRERRRALEPPRSPDLIDPSTRQLVTWTLFGGVTAAASSPPRQAINSVAHAAASNERRPVDRVMRREAREGWIMNRVCAIGCGSLTRLHRIRDTLARSAAECRRVARLEEFRLES